MPSTYHGHQQTRRDWGHWFDRFAFYMHGAVAQPFLQGQSLLEFDKPRACSIQKDFVSMLFTWNFLAYYSIITNNISRNSHTWVHESDMNSLRFDSSSCIQPRLQVEIGGHDEWPLSPCPLLPGHLPSHSCAASSLVWPNIFQLCVG